MLSFSSLRERNYSACHSLHLSPRRLQHKHKHLDDPAQPVRDTAQDPAEEDKQLDASEDAPDEEHEDAVDRSATRTRRLRLRLRLVHLSRGLGSPEVLVRVFLDLGGRPIPILLPFLLFLPIRRRPNTSAQPSHPLLADLELGADAVGVRVQPVEHVGLDLYLVVDR